MLNNTFKICLTIIFVFVLHTLKCQNIIKGKVFDAKNKTPLNGVNVVLKSKTENDEYIYLYTFSDSLGFFNIETGELDKINLSFSLLGYETKSMSLKMNNGIKKKELTVFLLEKMVELDEVIVQSETPIKIKNDTIVFDANFYSKGIEDTVEDFFNNITW